MRAQLTIEFLLLTVAYLALLFVLISAFSKISKTLENSFEKAIYSVSANKVSSLFSTKTINNPYLRYKMKKEECTIGEIVVCGREEKFGTAPVYIKKGEGNELA